MHTLTDGPRASQSLDGSWQFVPDPDDAGRERGYQDPDADWPADAREVSVPHAWQEVDALREYAGAA